MTEPLPTAKPEEVGLSQAALDRLSAALNDRIAAGHIPGAVALVARHGKVAYHQSFGRLDPARQTPMGTDAHLPHLFHDQGDRLGRRHDAVGGRPPAAERPDRQIPPRLRRHPGRRHLRRHLRPDRRANPITIQDLLRHTSGLTYEFRGDTPIHKAYADARVARLKQTNADHADDLAGLPLLHQPGTKWEYSRSTDVLGRLVEVISGQTLGTFLSERILTPLGHDRQRLLGPARRPAAHRRTLRQGPRGRH